MSKKKLLSENEIRRFQGLAGIPAIGEGMYGKPHGEREEEVEEGMHPDGGRHDDDEEMEEGMHPDGEREEEMGDEPMGDEPMGDLEMDVEMDPSDEGGDLDLSPEQKEDLAADIVRAVAQELSQALDLEEPIEVETDGGEDLEMDLGMGDDEELDLEVGDEPQQVTTIPKACATWKRKKNLRKLIAETAKKKSLRNPTMKNLTSPTMKISLTKFFAALWQDFQTNNLKKQIS